MFLNKWFESLTGFPYPWLKGHRLATCSDHEPGLICRGMACFPVSPAGGVSSGEAKQPDRLGLAVKALGTGHTGRDSNTTLRRESLFPDDRRNCHFREFTPTRSYVTCRPNCPWTTGSVCGTHLPPLLLPSARKSLCFKCVTCVTHAWDACPSPPATL